MKKFIYLPILFIFSFLSAFSFSDTTNIPLSRQVFHDRIIAEQKKADMLDGTLDGFIKLSSSEETNKQITKALITKTNVLRNDIEMNEFLATNNDKIKYLRFVQEMMGSFINTWRSHRIAANLASVVVNNFKEIMEASFRNENMSSYIQKVPYEVGLINANVFQENEGFAKSKKILFLKYATMHPDKILATIAPYADEPFADSLIVLAFKSSPTQLYSYAQNTNSILGKLLMRNPDNRIKTIVQLSKLNNALFYFPFLDDLISGKQTIENISKYVGNDHYDSVGYYKLMVKTEIDYYMRLVRKDTPVAMLGINGLTDMLQRKAVQHFITPINDLHEAPNPAVRFKAIEPLNAQELYYMITLGENDIYTSSYKYSFDRMLLKLGPKPRGDSLLMAVNFDKFKKFIKMAAGYNRLDTFLKTLPQSSATLMRAFVTKLETTGSLEDATDVADSYGSIKNPALLNSILSYVSDNEQRCIRENNSRGQTIYSLLKTIFLSADSTKKIDLTRLIGIPPVYTVANSRMTNDSGVIVQQVFFYGDKDGKESFRSYMTSFPKTDWNIELKKEWVEIKSRKGKPVWIYANLPLDNETDKDADAQKHLIEYLNTRNLRPTLVVHRGHSYHLPYTIEQLPESAKIIMLGSCGGYNNLKQILEFAPEAHIISTKQTGAKDVNKPIIETLNNTLRAGKDIDWRNMWTELDRSFAKAPRAQRDLFEDYIPPHKNLGAIFIKAYGYMENNIR
ncbi:hypothetical protein BH09BAC2_BH09BAC2_02480 [soil metagenome]